MYYIHTHTTHYTAVLMVTNDITKQHSGTFHFAHIFSLCTADSTDHPDRPFYYLVTLGSGDWQIICSSGTSREGC